MADGFSLLLVGDDAAAPALAAAMLALPARVDQASSLLAASELVTERRYDALITVARAGLEEARTLVQLATSQLGISPPPVAVFAAPEQASRVAELLDAGVDDVWSLELLPDELRARLRHLIARQKKVEHLQHENARLHELSVTDALTQVANRRAFQERLNEEFLRAQRYDDALGLILLDIDHFKLVNDRYGHQVGDRVLSLVAAAIRQAVRETDFVARYGGEEFAVVLPKTHLSGSLTVAERVSESVRRVRLDTDASFRVTASFGVSGYPGRQVHSVDQLVATADDALLRAKGEGRNRIFLFQPNLRAANDQSRPGS